jgi:general secretion pathway protein F
VKIMASWFPTFERFFSFRGAFRGWWPWYTTAGQRLALGRLLAVATEENLPLVPLLESWQDDESGLQRYRLRRLVRRLKEGRSLADALEEIPGILREEDVLAIRFDSQSGTRTAAVRAALDGAFVTADAKSKVLRALIYFCTVLPAGLLVASFTQMSIVPVLLKIFHEFGAQLPPALRWAAGWGGMPGGWWLLILAVLAVGLWMYATRKGREVRRSLFGRFFRPLHHLRSADVLQKLSIATASGRPLSGALSTLARYHFDPSIRGQLLFVRNEVEQGADVWHSLRAVGMLSPQEVHLVESSERLGNRTWVLERLVEAKARRTGRRLARAAELVLPAFVLLMLLLVVFQALTVIQPLVELIEAFS